MGFRTQKNNNGSNIFEDTLQNVRSALVSSDSHILILNGTPLCAALLHCFDVLTQKTEYKKTLPGEHLVNTMSL